MALLFSYGCDAHMALADKMGTNVNAVIDIDSGKFGTGTDSLKLPDDGDSIYVPNLIAPSSTRGLAANPFHMSFYVKQASNPSSQNELVELRSTSDSEFTILSISDSGVLQLHEHSNSITNAIVKASTTTAVTGGIWHHVEIKVEISNTVGVFKIWLDGVLEGDFSSGDNEDFPLIGNGFDVVLFKNPTNLVDLFIDDILIWDEEGTSFNTSGQMGLIRIETLIPNGDGNSTQLTPTGAGTTNADRVDEEGADDDTTYVASATSTHKDLYTYTDMVGSPTTIQGVVVHSRVANPDIGAISMRAVARSVATETNGTTVAVTAGGVYSQQKEIFALDPNTAAAWTKTGVNAAEFGVEVV